MLAAVQIHLAISYVVPSNKFLDAELDYIDSCTEFRGKIIKKSLCCGVAQWFLAIQWWPILRPNDHDHLQWKNSTGYDC